MTENEEQSKANRNAAAVRTTASAITSMTPSQREHLRALSDPHPNAAELASDIAHAQLASIRERNEERPKLADTIAQGVSEGLAETLVPILQAHAAQMEAIAVRCEAVAARIENATNAKEVQE